MSPSVKTLINLNSEKQKQITKGIIMEYEILIKNIYPYDFCGLRAINMGISKMKQTTGK